MAMDVDGNFQAGEKDNEVYEDAIMEMEHRHRDHVVQHSAAEVPVPADREQQQREHEQEKEAVDLEITMHVDDDLQHDDRDEGDQRDDNRGEDQGDNEDEEEQGAEQGEYNVDFHDGDTPDKERHGDKEPETDQDQAHLGSMEPMDLDSGNKDESTHLVGPHSAEPMTVDSMEPSNETTSMDICDSSHQIKQNIGQDQPPLSTDLAHDLHGSDCHQPQAGGKSKLGTSNNPIDLTRKPRCVAGKIIEIIDLTEDSVFIFHYNSGSD
jgi:hypothetical protein